MASQGKAYTKEQKEFIVRLKQSYDEERGTQATVSTRNPAGRVAQNLEAIRKPFSYCCSEIKQPPCGNETQGDYRVRAC